MSISKGEDGKLYIKKFWSTNLNNKNGIDELPEQIQEMRKLI